MDGGLGPLPVVSNEISGGVFFHAVIQGRDITVQLPPQITPALAGLPAGTPAFTGRDTQLAELLLVLAPGGREQQAVLVAAVAGLPGVGKTELVLQAAHRALATPNWFPGGVLFVDLFGYDPERRLPPERALGIPGEHLPADLQDRSRLFRSVLKAYADQDRRVLVVIDNASTAEQARPLLPTDGTTATLLTSRHTLDVGARLHDLDVLDSEAAVDLLRRALYQARGRGDTRVEEEPGCAREIVERCGGLPLALQICAALLADTPTRPLASLAKALADAHRRLDQLTREERAVRAAFDLSYQHLDSDQAHVFRLLSLNPGPDLDTEAAAHLAGASEALVEQQLQGLVRAHLIEPGKLWGRWRMHDLIRLYAAELAQQDDGDQGEPALDRLLEYYRVTADAADDHLRALPSDPVPGRFQDRGDALAWLDAERSNLVAAITLAAATARPHLAISLRASLTVFLSWRRHFDDAITTGQQALAATRELGDRYGEGTALTNLGAALWGVERFEEAIDAHTQAATVFRELGDRYGEGMALNNLGAALHRVRRFEEAIDDLAQAATICHEVGNQHREGTALTNLGLALAEVGRFEEAIDAHTQAATIHVEVGDRHSEGMALTNLGTALAEVGRFEEAIDALAQAATIFVEVGDRHAEGTALNSFGLAFQGMGRFEEAIDAHTQDLAISRELGDRHREGKSLSNLGGALTEVGRFEDAIDAHTQDLAIFRELGDRYGEGAALNNLGAAFQGVQRFEEAIDAHTQAASIFRELGDQRGESMVLSRLGLAFQWMGRFEEAIDAHTQDLAISRELGDRQSEGIALSSLGLAFQWMGRFEEAIDAHTQDLAISRELGDRQSEGMALDNLGEALAEVGRFEDAIDAHTQAATIFRELGDRQSEGTALDNLGEALAHVRGSSA
ncbi:tetratricopeptide (TPR) repeat protein [Streptomyces sp. V4I8]|uniref:tetratricopeptide repeat protein n=1 Tax=Streptomyces sp. V4I8 TaxID=3156469 RepID=UPI0035156F7E